MSQNEGDNQNAREAAARARQDPVIFGPDPFSQQPGWSAPEGNQGGDQGGDQGDESELPRPRWPVVVGIIIVVAVLVGVAGIWVR